MSLSDFIKQAESQHRHLKNEAFVNNVNRDGKSVSFAGVKLHPSMELDSFSNNDIVLFHACVHTVYANDKSKRDVLGSIHKNIRSEMENRKIEHFHIDKLDVTTKV